MHGIQNEVSLKYNTFLNPRPYYFNTFYSLLQLLKLDSNIYVSIYIYTHVRQVLTAVLYTIIAPIHI